MPDRKRELAENLGPFLSGVRWFDNRRQGAFAL